MTTPLRPPAPRRPLVLGAAVLAALLLALTASLRPAAAADGLDEVPDFGSNPGNLAMYTYAPADLPEGAPLVVALHGCTQTANDYYAHSGWPELADRYHFAVVFPQTSAANNVQSCFQWFDPAEDSRDAGEAASVRQMVAKASETYGSDAARVFVTGLSAGGGMTANLLADYPDVFAGGAVHAGLPAQCATSLVEATGCQLYDQRLTPAQWGDKVRDSHPGHEGPWPRVAIFHGTSDTTVAPVNGEQLRDQWTDVRGVGQEPTGTEELPGNTTLTTYGPDTDRPDVALFSIAGMGHGLGVDPGAGDTQCGTAGAYFLASLCSSYYSAHFWGIDE
ncbi:extracellular catalytic domain type 1 short-chain-length polyhydroxyalkanoate depolymerase [Streptomyces sulphureus]|uniref:extracellular catalytic domain type 1 short-chain-length polyhydroxyalkanoate depolymerase n=1 Tax=Streptomyces sulphureus TaxID=47758 RepID=UPI0003619F85|nr:PHB depolymerase family esterase [Streptomyces sulphureus]